MPNHPFASVSPALADASLNMLNPRYSLKTPFASVASRIAAGQTGLRLATFHFFVVMYQQTIEAVRVLNSWRGRANFVRFDDGPEGRCEHRTRGRRKNRTIICRPQTEPKKSNSLYRTAGGLRGSTAAVTGVQQRSGRWSNSRERSDGGPP